MPAHPATAGSLERTVAAQQLRRSLQEGAEDGDFLVPENFPAPHPGRALQQLSLAAPPGGWAPEDAGSSRYRHGGDTPTQAELDAAWAANERLAAQNAAMDAELADLEDRAEASVLHMSQMRRVLAQLKKHKEAFSLAPDDNITAALDVIRSLNADDRAAADSAIAAASNGGGGPNTANPYKTRRPRSGKRQCTRRSDSEGEAPARAAAEAARYAEGAAEARAAAALCVSAGDPAQALIHLLDLYVRIKTDAPAAKA